MDTSEGETLHFIEVYGQRLIVNLGTAGRASDSSHLCEFLVTIQS